MMKLSPKHEVILSILSYSLCSGTLVLLNKLTLHYLPFPSLVVAVQLMGCILMIYGANYAGYIKVDPLNWEYVKPYLLYTFFFSTGVYCNMRSLNISNVETVIVFRALTPVIVAFLDALFLGRDWPSNRSWAGLTILVVGAYGYASYDEKFQTQGYSAYYWPSLYTIVIALEMVSANKSLREQKRRKVYWLTRNSLTPRCCCFCDSGRRTESRLSSRYHLRLTADLSSTQIF